jgi:hypothetical protein
MKSKHNKETKTLVMIPLYKMRVEKDKTKYNKKVKHKGKGPEGPFYLTTISESYSSGGLCLGPEFTYKPNHAAPAPVTTEINPACSSVGFGNAINHVTVLYSR